MTLMSENKTRIDIEVNKQHYELLFNKLATYRGLFACCLESYGFAKLATSLTWQKRRLDAAMWLAS